MRRGAVVLKSGIGMCWPVTPPGGHDCVMCVCVHCTTVLEHEDTVQYAHAKLENSLFSFFNAVYFLMSANVRFLSLGKPHWWW